MRNSKKIEVGQIVFDCSGGACYRTEIIEIKETKTGKNKSRFDYLLKYKNGHTEYMKAEYFFRTRTAAIKYRIRQLENLLIDQQGKQ